MIGPAILWIAISSVGPAIPAPPGAPADDEERRVQEIQAQIREIGRRERDAGTRERSLLDSLERLDALADLHRREQEALARRGESLRKKREYSGNRIEALEGSVEDLRRQLAGRLEMIYRAGRVRYAGALLGLGRGSATALRQLGFLADRDREGIVNLRAEQGALAEAEGAVVADERALQALRERAASSAEELAKARAEKERLLGRIRHEKAQAERVRGDLESAGRKFQSFVVSLPEETLREPALQLENFKGRLEWPVRGRILQRFGRSGDPRYDIPSHGIGIEAPAGTTIRAVHPGRVVFADWYKGYGKTLIVDHGGGWFTVYGHASDILVGKDERVGTGDPIALVGDTGSIKGPFLYFQMNRDRKPVDPQEYLKP